MIKKILLITARVAVIGILVFGAVNRTLARNTSEGTGQGGVGRGRGEESTLWNAEESGGLAQTPGNGRRQGAIGEAQEGAFDDFWGGDLSSNQGRQQGGNQAEGYGQDGELAYLPPATPGESSTEESAALLYMLEEEKLAHDVYERLYELWGLGSFQNISQSEQTHMNAVLTLIDRYSLSNPASNEPGVFTNPDLQALYDELIQQGSNSLAEALKVGAAIEEIDILDLEERLAETDNADIQQVFNSLINGSKNHLRAFVSTLERQTGESYQPQYMSAESYQAILDSGMTGGRNNGGGFGGGGFGRGAGNGQGRGGNGGSGGSL